MRERTFTAPRRFLALALAVTSLMSCQAVSSGTSAPPPITSGTSLSKNFSIDVDTMRAHAFEHPTRQIQTVTSGGLLVDVEFPQVSYDPATQQTTITMQMTNAGTNLTFLKCQVSASVSVVAPQWPFNTAISKPGQSQTVKLVFADPGGNGFNISVNFTGILSSDHSSQTGLAQGGVTPTASTAPGPSASPGASPAPSSPGPTPTPATGGTTIRATASDSYGVLTPDLAVDGDLSSYWACDGYEAPEATLTLDTGSVRSLTSLSVKMRPQSGGAYYQVEVSSDGNNFQSVTGQLRNSTWGLESKALNAGTQGRYLRLHFINDPSSPELRFCVFEAQINSASNSGGTPSPAPSMSPLPSPGPSATPSPLPSPSGNPTGGLNETFAEYAQGTDPKSSFIDPNDEGYAYSWMPRVNWYVTNYNGSMQYKHDGLSNTANLSFRRWRGTDLGTLNGQLPAKYHAELQVTPLQSYTYSPTGDQGTQFYYLDPTHYIELLIKPTQFEVWEANSAAPFQSNGWTRLYYTPTSTAAGQTRTFAANVDTSNQSMQVYLDGQFKTTINSVLLKPQVHYFALRGTGNIVVFDNIRIAPL